MFSFGANLFPGAFLLRSFHRIRRIRRPRRTRKKQYHSQNDGEANRIKPKFHRLDKEPRRPLSGPNSHRMQLCSISLLRNFRLSQNISQLTIVRLSSNRYMPKQLHFPVSRKATMPLEVVMLLNARPKASMNFKKRKYRRPENRQIN